MLNIESLESSKFELIFLDQTMEIGTFPLIIQVLNYLIVHPLLCLAVQTRTTRTHVKIPSCNNSLELNSLYPLKLSSLHNSFDA